MAGAVGCELLPQVHLIAKNGELAIIADVAPVWQFKIVFCQDVEHDGQQHDGVALVCLLPVVINQPVPLHLLTLRKVDVEQVDVCEAGVT